MLTIKKNDVYLTRGDSAYITISIDNMLGDEFVIDSVDMLQLQVRTEPNIGDLIFDGTLIESDGEYIWYIRPSDTNNLDIGTYYYDVQVTFPNGDVFTFIKASKFVLTDEVTRPGGV